MSCRVLCTVILRILRMGACLAGWGIGRDQGRAESYLQYIRTLLVILLIFDSFIRSVGTECIHPRLLLLYFLLHRVRSFAQNHRQCNAATGQRQRYVQVHASTWSIRVRSTLYTEDSVEASDELCPRACIVCFACVDTGVLFISSICFK